MFGSSSLEEFSHCLMISQSKEFGKQRAIKIQLDMCAPGNTFTKVFSSVFHKRNNTSIYQQNVTHCFPYHGILHSSENE